MTMKVWLCFSSLQYAYTEEYEQQRGKGSFPAHLTPGYMMSKKASEQASNVSEHTPAHTCNQETMLW